LSSQNSVVQAIINGTAPQTARLAAARGMLPLQQNELLEILVALVTSDNAEIAAAAKDTLESETQEDLAVAASAEDTAPSVLAYLVTQTEMSPAICEAAVLNPKTPDDALVKLAAATAHGTRSVSTTPG
jgi:hypothetical protein